MAKTLQELVESASQRGDAPAVLSWNGTVEALSFGELAIRARRLAAGLAELGLERQSRAVLFSRTRAEWIVAALGLVEAAAVPIPIDVQTPEGDLERVLADCRPRYIFTTRDLARRLDERGLAAEVPKVFLDGDEHPRSLARLLAAEVRRRPTGTPAADDTALIFYTSGTTGTPKGVPLTHRNLLTNLEALLDLGIVGADDRVLLPLPLHHVYPFVVGVLAPLMAGVPIVLPGGLTGPALMRALRDGEVTAIIGVPRLYAALDHAIDRRVRASGQVAAGAFRAMLALSAVVQRWFRLRIGRWLFAPVRRRVAPRLRLLASGGAALDEQLGRRLEALGWDVASGYGLTETSPILTFNAPGRGRLASAGQPLRDVELRIAPPAEGGEHGEVLARGPNVFSGYLDRPDETRRAFTEDGWFRTGDLGYLDDAGFLYLAGRASALIVRPGGENVWPEDVERVLEQGASIAEAGVLQRKGDLVALVVPERGARDTGDPDPRARIREDVEAQSSTLPTHHRVGEWAVTNQPLPRTHLGKLRRHELPERWKRASVGDEEPRRAGPVPVNELTPEDQELLADAAARSVWDWLIRRDPRAPVSPDAHLELDLGIDSVGWLELSLEIRERTGRTLDPERIAAMERVRDVLVEVAGAARDAGDTDALDQLAHPVELLDESARAWLAPRPAPVRGLGALLLGVGRMLSRRVFRLEVDGLDRLPASGPVVLVPNHASLVDPIVLAAALPTAQLRRAWWAGWSGIMFTNPLTRLVSRATRVVPVDPERGPVASLALGAAVLQRGDLLVWFPEGQRSATGALGEFRPGIGLLLAAASAPALPVSIAGSHAALPPGAWRPRRVAIRIRFGEPVPPSVLEGEGSGDTAYRRITAALRARVEALG